jgi:hypothetical protein
MRNLAIIENGIVINAIAIADGADGDKEIAIRGGVELGESGAGIGWSYDGNSFIKPEPTAEELEAQKVYAEQQALKDSANSKLAALGLTPEEIAAITGDN